MAGANSVCFISHISSNTNFSIQSNCVIESGWGWGWGCDAGKWDAESAGRRIHSLRTRYIPNTTKLYRIEFACECEWIKPNRKIEATFLFTFAKISIWKLCTYSKYAIRSNFHRMLRVLNLARAGCWPTICNYPFKFWLDNSAEKVWLDLYLFEFGQNEKKTIIHSMVFILHYLR